jgi:large subunit ribosomal protein L35
MPKLKTHKGANSRFHVTGSGKLMRAKCGKSHLRRKKAPRTKRLYDETIPVSPADKKRVRRLLPYGV